MKVERPIIKRLWARNFRSLHDVQVDLGPLTVLVGPNASGKSNTVDVLRFVAESIGGRLDDAIMRRHGIGAIRRWSAKGRPYDVEVGLEIAAPDWSFEYMFVLGGEAHSQYRVKREHGKLRGQGQPRRDWEFEAQDGKLLKPEVKDRDQIAALRSDATSLVVSRLPGLVRWTPDREIEPDRLFFSVFHLAWGMRFYHIFPNMFRNPQKPGNPMTLGEHGENLSSVLREIVRSKDPFLPDLVGALGKVVPGVCEVRVTLVGGYLVVKLKHAVDGSDGKGAWFDISEESDGTLRLLGLLVALFHNPQANLIAIEEPELNIHPGALAVLAELLQETSRRAQVIVTTHSPDLIDRLPLECLRVVSSVGGATLVAPVADHQREAVRRRLFTTGELHRTEGLQPASAKG